MINADKPHLWKADVAASVDMYNSWFLASAPKAYRDTRLQTIQQVEETMRHTADFANIGPADLKSRPGILPTLRMATAPPIARDRLVGLAYVNRNLVGSIEKVGILPPHMAAAELDAQLTRMCGVITKLLDRDLFPWLETHQPPTEQERMRAASIVADRLCGAVADPIVRNAQEARQLALIEGYLTSKGYRKKSLAPGSLLIDMQPGTFAFRMGVRATQVKDGIIQVDMNGNARQVNIPVDVVIQPHSPRPGSLPIFIEAKSAGDYTNPNKRRKEEATKFSQLRATFGSSVELILFLCGYFDSGYLGYEAAEGLDWVWEHRIEDMDQMGI